MTIIKENKKHSEGADDHQEGHFPTNCDLRHESGGQQKYKVTQHGRSRPLGLALILEDQRSNVEVYVGHRG